MTEFDVAVVGGGFTGLSAAMTLARAGAKVVVLEADDKLGGLASTFEFSDGVEIERFYHHWFTNDAYVPKIVAQLGMSDSIKTLPSRTGMYLNGRIWDLSSPLDLLKFRALPFTDRVRLGISTLRARKVNDWQAIEGLTIREWLAPLCGDRAYDAVWEPLVRAKFGKFADEITAVWMWKKLVLRGSTRNSKGGEELAYFKGGFGRLANAIGGDIEGNGGTIRLNSRVTGVRRDGEAITGLLTSDGTVSARSFLFTPALPIVAEIFAAIDAGDWHKSLLRVQYLGNICLVLRLKRSLSDTYWLNVNDPGFPFVGVIEHTNLDDSANYGGDRIAYLSRYVAADDAAWGMSDDEYLDWALEHLARMFPDFDRDWIRDHRTWRADYAQPITERFYSKYVPPTTTPWPNVTLASMAQIYPEDRGTNYAIRDGIAAAEKILSAP